MGKVSRTVLKSYFETGDIPTEAQFIDLMDSILNFVSDGNPIVLKANSVVQATTIGVALTIISPIFTINANELSSDGEMLVFNAVGVMSADGQPRNFSAFVNGIDNLITFPAVALLNKGWNIEIKLIRKTNAIAILVITGTASISAPSVGSDVTAVSVQNSFAYDFTTAGSLVLKAQALVSGSVTFDSWSVRKFSL